MVIGVKTLIEEITGNLNQTLFKAKDIVYYNSKNSTTEYKIEILTITHQKVTMLILASNSETVGICQFDFELIFDRPHSALKYSYSKKPKLKW